MPYKFPASDLDSAQTLLASVGGFWNGVYQGSFLVESLLYARARLEEQTHLDFLELLASVSRFKLPVFHTDVWYLLTLKESERNQAEANLAKFDGTYTFESGIEYDVPVDTEFHVWQLPAGLVNFNLALNRITASSVSLAKGVDYFLKDGAVWFRQNPFENDLVAKREVFEDGVITDRECGLWLYRGQWDWDAVYTQFSYALGMKLKSSQAAKDLVNAIFDALTLGCTDRYLNRAFSAVCGVPLAKGAETVEHTYTDRRGLWVVTDKNVYRFHQDANLLVDVGDALVEGQALTDALRFFEFGRGQVPSEIRALSVGKGLLAEGYFQDLVFENKEVSTEIDEDQTWTRLTFEVGGFPLDVQKFWDDVHRKGVESGQTLAMLLDRRTNKTGQPKAAALPLTINPLGFLLQNVFRNNLFVVLIRANCLGPDALGLQHARFLRRILPPHTCCIVLAQLEATDEVTMDGPGDETTPGYEEDLGVFLGLTNTEEVEGPDQIEEELRVFQINGRCQ